MLHSSPFIELYSVLINKKNNVSQIQGKSRFVVTVSGDSKRIDDVKGLQFPWFCQILNVFLSASYKVLILKGELN